jgi:hypothetical protein
MKRKGKEDDERTYEVKLGADAKFAILPGENPIEFEILRGQLAEELAPDGPLEEDLVLTIAKCIWRKRRYQNLLLAKTIATHFEPKQKEHHEERQALDTFYRAISYAMSFEEVQQSLDQLGACAPHFAAHLLFEYPRGNFRESEEWVRAMQELNERLMLSITLREVAVTPAAITDDVFARELEFEARSDRTIEQTLDRLEKVKAAKRRVSFREAQRFDRSHRSRLVRFEK